MKTNNWHTECEITLTQIEQHFIEKPQVTKANKNKSARLALTIMITSAIN